MSTMAQLIAISTDPIDPDIASSSKAHYMRIASSEPKKYVEFGLAFLRVRPTYSKPADNAGQSRPAAHLAYQTIS